MQISKNTVVSITYQLTDSKGKVMAIEILGASKILPKDFQKASVKKQVEFVVEK